MSRLLAVRYDSERVYGALIKNGAVTSASSIPIVSAKNSSESISNTIRALTAKAGFHDRETAMCLPDNDCLTRLLEIGAITEAELNMNLPYEFGEFIPSGAEGDYIFDYQTMAGEKGAANQILAVAVSRRTVNFYRDLADDSDLELVRLVPETLALGDLVEAGAMRGKLCCIITVDADSTMLRIFRGSRNMASHEITGGIAMVKEAMMNHNVSFFNGSKENRAAVLNLDYCRENVESVCTNIVSALAYFLERRLLRPYTPIFLAGEGALIPSLGETLSRSVGDKCENIAKLIPGQIDNETAAMLAPAIGAAMIR